MIFVPGNMRITTDPDTGGWIVRADWHGQERTVFAGWVAKDGPAQMDSACARLSLWDCIDFVKEHAND